MTRGTDPTAVIPHRPPILCIDRIVAVETEFAVTERTVVEGLGVRDGELWEPGLVECLAQTAAVLNAHDEKKSGRTSKKGMLVGVRKFEVARRARVGETLTLRVELIRRITPLTLMRCTAHSGDECLARGEMKFYVEIVPS